MRELSYDKEGMFRSTVLALLSNISILSLGILLQIFLKEEHAKSIFFGVLMQLTLLLPNINQTYSDKIDINLSLLWICFQLRPINRFLLPRFSLRSCEWPLGSIKKRDILVENMFFSFYIIRLISGRINNVVTSCPKANYFKSLYFSFYVKGNV